MNKFKNRDCMQDLKEYPDNLFDLAIVDPPYGIGMDSTHFETSSSKTIANNYGVKEWDKSAPNKNYFYELFRISNNQIIFGANHFISLIAFDSSCWIVWDKDNGDSIHADCELAWTSFKTAVRRYKYTWHGMRQENMAKKESRIHPTQKPVALYIWLLKNYAKPGDLILDTHVGSASSLIACEKMDFDYVGYEIDTDYYNAAQQRLKEFRMQTDLFKDQEQAEKR